MKRKLLCGILLPLVLASCSKQGYAGTYSFQLGKNSGAHASASITLQDEAFDKGGTSYGKKMTLFGQARFGPESTSSETSPVDSSADSSIAAEEPSNGFSDAFNELLKDGVTLPGYYIVAEEKGNGRNRLKLGFDLSTLVPEEGADLLDLPPEAIENFVYSEIDSKKIYLQIPVSFMDLQLQLYWYGLDFSFLGLLDAIVAGGLDDEGAQTSESQSGSEQSSVPSSDSSKASSSGIQVEAHEPGTKPTDEDIEEINKTYPASHNGQQYRRFYTVALSLTRQ